jgi:hypothetical protein
MQRAILQQHPTEDVSKYVLQQRINRKLKESGRVLRKGRGKKEIETCGEYFVVDLLDVTGSYIHARHIDLHKMARELGCIAHHERLDQGGK